MEHLVKRLLRPGPPDHRLAPSAVLRSQTEPLGPDDEAWSVRVHVDDPGADLVLREAVRFGIGRTAPSACAGLVVVCVGTDRSTGDALGPLTGDRLQTLIPGSAMIFGTLEDPVHAGNLGDCLEAVKLRYPDRVVVAVDACLGSLENVGTICVGLGPLRPGAGVNKTLPPVGDLHITGVVNVGGFMEYFVLQNTRLHLVVKMSGVIASGLAGIFSGRELQRAAARASGRP